jgi:hypothetical protein
MSAPTPTPTSTPATIVVAPAVPLAAPIITWPVVLAVAAAPAVVSDGVILPMPATAVVVARLGLARRGLTKRQRAGSRGQESGHRQLGEVAPPQRLEFVDHYLLLAHPWFLHGLLPPGNRFAMADPPASLIVQRIIRLPCSMKTAPE